jgi:hypothetical protein
MLERRYYQSRLLITGVTLLILGGANAFIGSRKLAQYERVVAEGAARGYLAESDAGLRGLGPVDENDERYHIGRAKVDLYHVVLSGGLLMIGVGMVLTTAAWIRLRLRRDGATLLHAPATRGGSSGR